MFRYIFYIVLLQVYVGESRKIMFNNEYARAYDQNTSFFKLKYFSFNKYNRTAKVANVEFDLSNAKPFDFDNDVDVLFGFSVFKSNEYKKTPIVIPVKLCRILRSKTFDLAHVMSNSSINNCPINKGHHYIYNIMLTSNGWPSSLPNGRYLMELSLVYEKQPVVTIEWMLEIIAV